MSGPAGIGKSALIAEVCRQGDRIGVRSAVATFDSIRQVSPGASLIAALRVGREPLVTAERYEQIVQAVHEPLLLVDRIATALESAMAGGPILLALDDIQWADRVSRFVVRVLLSRLPTLPVAWLLASRDEDTELLSPEHTRVEHIHLTPLTASDLAAIAQDRLGHAPDERTRRFLEASAGNPLLATEVLDNLARAAARGEPDTVPEQFGAAIMQRFNELSESAHELVELVAVAGRPVPLREAACLAGVADYPYGHRATLTAALTSSLITQKGETLIPRHELVREVLSAVLPDHRVRDLHRRFAEHNLEEGRALVAAAHARAAAVLGDTVSAMILIAAAEKVAVASPDDAGDLADLAFRNVTPDQPEWLEVGRRCLSVLCRTQRASDAIAVADRLLAHVDDTNLSGTLEADAARALWLSGRLSEMLSRSEPALKDLDALAPEVGARLKAAHALANTRILTGQSAASEAESALGHARVTGDVDALVLALLASGEAARNEGRHTDALKYFRELRRLAGPHQFAEEIKTLQFLDRYDHAQLLLDEVSAARKNTERSILPGLHCAQLWQDFNLGRSAEAESRARTLLDLGREFGSGIYALDAVIVQASAALLRGDTRGAATRLANAEQLTTTDGELHRPALTVMRGWLAARQGETAKALERLRPILAGGLGSYGYWPLSPCWMGLFYDIGASASDKAFVEVVIQVAELAATRNPGVASFEGIALSVRGRHIGDMALIAEAKTSLARSPRPILRAYGAEHLGRAMLARGHRSDALAQLDQAWEGYNQIDARGYRAEVQRVMRAAGARRAKWSTAGARPDTGWAALTTAERRVALLVADGHTNRSVADELGISTNTVSTHLRLAFSKLGVRSRVQLANVLRGAEA